MIKKALISTIVCGLLAGSAAAAEQAQLGVGVGLSASTTTVRVPIDIENNLRIEPEFGLNYQSADNNDFTKLSIGAGVYVMKQPAPKINLYFGGKALIDYDSYDYGNGADDSTTQFNLGGVFGFEYLFDRHFSAGGEAGAYLGLGDATTLSTVSLALLRYYF